MALRARKLSGAFEKRAPGYNQVNRGFFENQQTNRTGWRLLVAIQISVIAFGCWETWKLEIVANGKKTSTVPFWTEKEDLGAYH